ncbi:winged helix-turn-helix domain-containing protein [Halomonas sp. LBP4]|uniref:winged helix-turn-helix domain-containing protein n=1 Tax=Halomonas sp. LBP4 TaxID=2044917 RepID=UPI000D76D1E9|nr:winged helix-turn-helix domain-containing protein [Halomonas sp. LBP4]PXY00431.1 DNA-binding response regulator [Halomonas sp. LBP4]
MDDSLEPQEQDHVLIIEDDERLAGLTRDYLEANGFRVTLEADGARGVEQILALQPDLVILDLMLPGEDGLSICRRVRADYPGPILMLTARTDDMDQVLGLEMGADDYVPKPVQPRVLLARMRALLRRTDPSEPGGETRLAFGNLEIDSATREAWLEGERIDLTSAEFDLLWLLASNAGRVLTREEIFSQLRGIKYDGQDRSIDVRVSRIRPKIGDDPNQPHRIKTVRSKGYLFVRDS